MRPKSLILLALSLGCGLIASIGISQVMESRGEAPPPEETQLVLVAMARIDRNTELSAQNIRLDALPVGKVPPNAIKSLEEVEGRRPGTVIFPGSVILEPMLGSGIVNAANQIPQGMRVVSVRVDNTSGAGMIRPGNRVDVQLYARKNPNAGIPEAGTWTILQDVSVFAIDAIISDDENNESLAAKTISLLVTPEQAAKVTLATEIGVMRLVMRGLTDKTEAKTFNIGIQELLGKTEKLGEKETDDGGNGRLGDFLDQQQARTPVRNVAPQVADASVAEKWTMRILSGLRVRVDRFENGAPLHDDGEDLGGQKASTNFQPAKGFVPDNDSSDNTDPSDDADDGNLDEGPALGPLND